MLSSLDPLRRKDVGCFIELSGHVDFSWRKGRVSINASY